MLESVHMLRTYALLFVRLVTTVRNWPVYFLNRFGLTKGVVEYRLRSGMTILSRPYSVDGSALNEVWFDHCYDPNFFGLPFDWKNAKHVVDVGGHIGTFTLFAAAHAPDASIVTLEPEADNFAVLAANIAANHLLNRVTLHNVGLGDGNSVELFTFPGDHGGNSVYRPSEGGIPVRIETISLPTLFEKHGIDRCDYLKLDCEGAEYEALYGLPAEYFPRIRCIGMEYHHFSKDPRHNGGSLQAFLESKGFRCVRHKKSMMFAIR